MPGYYDGYWDNNVPDSVVDGIHDRTGFSDDQIFNNALEGAFEMMDEFDIPTDDAHDFWNDFVDAMVTGEMDREDFFDEWGIDEADFPWELWREIMGY